MGDKMAAPRVTTWWNTTPSYFGRSTHPPGRPAKVIAGTRNVVIQTCLMAMRIAGVQPDVRTVRHHPL